MAEQAVLYDRTQSQRVPLKLEKKGKLYNVAHVFAPLIDDDILAYERERDLRISDADVGEADGSAVAFSTNSFRAAVRLWDHLAVGLDGYKLRDGAIEQTRLDELKTKVDPRDKAFAIESGLLAVGIVPLPEADGEDAYFLDDDADTTSTILLHCLFNGQQLVTKHILREPTSAELGQFQKVMSRTLILNDGSGEQDRKLPSRARKLGDLYDAMLVSTEGYANGVPIHHKAAVVLNHLQTQQKVVQGN